MGERWSAWFLQGHGGQKVTVSLRTEGSIMIPQPPRMTSSLITYGDTLFTYNFCRRGEDKDCIVRSELVNE